MYVSVYVYRFYIQSPIAAEDFKLLAEKALCAGGGAWYDCRGSAEPSEMIEESPGIGHTKYRLQK